MMADTPQLQTLGSSIASTSQHLSNLLSQASMPQPSLLAGGPTMYPSASEHPQIFLERAKLAEMSMQMFQLAMGPGDTLRWMVGPSRLQIGMLKVIDHFNIEAHVPSTPPGSSIPISDLAERLQVDGDLLSRILHLAFSFNIFEESPRGHIRHTALSQALPALKAWTTLNCRDDFQKPLMSWPDAIRIDSTSHSPWHLSNNSSNNESPQSFFAKLSTEPAPNGMALFGRAMRDHTAVTGANTNLYLSAFDFASLGSGPLIDVGGGNGHVAVTIAQAFPSLHIIVQDTPGNAQPAADTIPAALRDRVTYQVHDFFEPQPPQLHPPKAYLLKAILHDWPDRDAVRILKQLMPLLEAQDGARIFVMDRVLPAPGTKPTVQDSLVYFMDLLMFSLLDAKERHREGVEVLLREVDPRLRILKFTQPVGSEYGFMEVGF